MNWKIPKTKTAKEEKIARLIRKLRETEEELKELTAGRIEITGREVTKSYFFPEARQKPVHGHRGEKLERLVERQAAILDALPAHIVVVDDCGVIVAVNEACRRFGEANAFQGSRFGIGQNYVELCESAQGDGAEEAWLVAAKLREILAGKINEFSLDYACHSPTKARWFRLVGSALGKEQLRGILVTHINITEQKLTELRLVRINQFYAALSKVNEAIARMQDQRQLFEQVCQIAVEDGLFRMAAVMTVDKETGVVHPLTHAGAEGGYFTEISIKLSIPELNRGTVGAAFRTKAYDICNDTMNDPRMSAWREAFLRHGFRSTASFPILVEGEVTAVLLLFAGGANYFAQDEVALLTSVQRNLSFAVESLSKEEKKRQAERALIRSQRQLELILQSVGEGIHSLDAAGRVVFENQAASKMFDWPTAEMTDHSLVRQHPADGRGYPIEKSPINETLHDGQTRRKQNEVFFRKDGSSFPVDYVCSPVRDETGAITGVVVCFQDVSERKRTEEALRAQATLLDNAQRIGRMGSWYTDLRCGRVNWSEATCALFGITLAEFRGTFEHFCSFILPEDLPAFDAVLAAISPTQPLLEAEFRIRRPDGSVRWMYERGNVEFDASGAAIRRIGMITDVTEQRLAREQLERGTRLLSIAGKAARLGGWAIELPERKLTWSEETCILHDLPSGYQPSFEEGVSYFPTEHRTEVLNHVEACARDGTPYDFEVPKHTAKGRRIWVRCIGEAVRDDHGKIIRLQGAFQDVTERKQAELALFKSNRALRMLSACGEALTHITDENRLLKEVCRVAVEIGNYRMAWVGYALEDQNRNIQPMAHAGEEKGYLAIARINWAEDNQAGLGLAGRCIRTGRLICCADIEQETSLADWRKEALARGYRSIICLPLRDDHRTFGVLGLYSSEFFQAEDEELKLFTELADDLSFGINNIRARGEQRLAEQKIARQAELLDKATDAILVRDLEHRVLHWNKSAERVYGWKAEEVIGRSITEFVHPDLGEYQTAMRTLRKEGEWGGELRKKNRFGQELILDCRWTLVDDAKDAPQSVLCIETDITEKKKLEGQIFRAQRLESIGTLAGGIAHDLNNLLAPIMISVQLLRRDVKDGETRKILDTLEACSQRGASLVQQVLSFARGVEGQRIQVDLTSLLAELQLVMQEIFPKNIELALTLEKGLWTVMGDPTQLHQVFLNLCVNARDAMPNGGRLRITMENVAVDENHIASIPDCKTGEFVMVTVSDTGTGIPPGILDKIFEPFFTTKEHAKGTGLGLSTVMGIVKSHGGFISVASDPGQGTEFEVYLPAKSLSSTPEIAPPIPPNPRRGNGELILLVDDEHSIREVTSKTLERFGYRALLAGNGAEALVLYAQRQKEIALVITDVSMPIMDGAALVQALRSINPNALILVSSGMPTSSTISKAKEAGIQCFLPKPYTADALLIALQQELSRPRNPGGN